MSDCVFCGIVAGSVEASIVHEDEVTIAFMDLSQPNGAHVLVIPRQHIETIYDLEPDVGAGLMQTVVRTARAVRRSLQPAGLSIWQSNGPAAGQDVPHVHVHLLTRQPQDGFLRVFPGIPARPARAILDQLADKIRAGFV